MTPAAWSVDLPALHDAITQVSAQHQSISNQFVSIQRTFHNIEYDWSSPAGNNFLEATTNFNKVAVSLLTVLEDAIGRMKTSYQNYLTTEATNTQNLQ
jgi:uncharacterized protein YukE